MAKNVVLGLLVAALIGVLVFSDRPWVLYSRPALAKIADLPAAGQSGDLAGYTIAYGMFVAQPRSKALVAGRTLKTIARGQEALEDHDYGHGPAALGYSMREWGILGMPLLAVKELGQVAYVERNDHEGSWQVPLEGDGMDLLTKQIGRDPGAGFIYPYWRHLWGWLFIAGVGLYAWLRMREIRRMRLEQGLI